MKLLSHRRCKQNMKTFVSENCYRNEKLLLHFDEMFTYPLQPFGKQFLEHVVDLDTKPRMASCPLELAQSFQAVALTTTVGTNNIFSTLLVQSLMQGVAVTISSWPSYLLLCQGIRATKQPVRLHLPAQKVQEGFMCVSSCYRAVVERENCQQEHGAKVTRLAGLLCL